ncbi:cysteine--tRNA ligase [Actinomadura sp. ATCC 31491]|uniref:Cysteine--tRNA ligase n=1 Tax=Actinomadura luzonensis TaxID=2805427 RepID=A0ABT0FJD0_9ACTN|nr:cysteine--tRNA ligase [Actinomadura luzonensis]MCK2212406.1 cysteine--tRNA ligase [Actinomadura luzonensis]
MVIGAPVKLFNSMGRRVVPFQPREAGRVGIYSCGPTVYAHQHLGNMRPYVFSDTLRRLLEWKGLQVRHVINITDVGHVIGDGDVGEDKVEAAARRELLSVRQVTDRYTQIFLEDHKKLRILPPEHRPKASEYVPQMIEFATVLEERGFAYRLPSGLYFDTAKSPGYGNLGLLTESDYRERIDNIDGKRAPADFALWRADAPGERRVWRWDSPWGPGVPGWHLECSVMSIHLLGSHFDIHTGGVDHRQIHHVNEIAQSEAYLDDGRPWVDVWLHNEFLILGGQKISKSAGRMPVLDDLVAAGLHPLAFRHFLLAGHYRSQLDLTDDAVRGSAAALRRLLLRAVPFRPLPVVETLAEARRQLTSEQALESLERYDAALSDDLSTPRALAELHAVLRDDAIDDKDKAVLLAAAEQTLALGLGDLAPEEVTTSTRQLAVPADYVEEMIQAREEARGAKDWARADQIRDQLRQLGVVLVDTAEGTRWEVAERRDA